MEDRRCKLGLQGRLELVRLVEQGSTLRAAAAALSVAPATAHRWWHRWQARQRGRARVAGVSAHALLAAAVVSVGAERRGLSRRSCRAREKTNYGPMQLQLSDRPASLDDLEGARASRRVAPAPQPAPAEHAAL